GRHVEHVGPGPGGNRGNGAGRGGQDVDDVGDRPTVEVDRRGREGRIERGEGERLAVVAEVDRQRVGRVGEVGHLEPGAGDLRDAGGHAVVAEGGVVVAVAGRQVEDDVVGGAGVDQDGFEPAVGVVRGGGPVHQGDRPAVAARGGEEGVRLAGVRAAED